MIQIPPKKQWLLLVFLIASSLLLAALIISDWMPFLRGPAPETSEWFWPYLLRPLSRWWPAFLAAGVFWILAAWWLSPEQTNRRRNLVALLGLIVTAFILQIAIIYADQPNSAGETINRTLSNLSSGFFEPAAEIVNMDAVLRDYPREMLTFASEHAQTHPPGLIAANWLTVQAFSRWPAFAEYLAHFVRPLRCTDLWLLNRPPEVAAALAFWSILPLLCCGARHLTSLWPGAAAAGRPCPTFGRDPGCCHSRLTAFRPKISSTLRTVDLEPFLAFPKCHDQGFNLALLPSRRAALFNDLP